MKRVCFHVCENGVPLLSRLYASVYLEIVREQIE